MYKKHTLKWYKIIFVKAFSVYLFYLWTLEKSCEGQKWYYNIYHVGFMA